LVFQRTIWKEVSLKALLELREKLGGIGVKIIQTVEGIFWNFHEININ